MLEDQTRKRITRQGLVVLGALIVLALNVLVEYRVYQVRVAAQQSFQALPYFSAVIAANLLAAISLLALALFVRRFPQRLRAAGVALILLGLPLLFFPLLFFGTELTLPPTVTRVLSASQANTRSGMAAAFTIALGFYLLLGQPRSRPAT